MTTPDGAPPASGKKRRCGNGNWGRGGAPHVGGLADASPSPLSRKTTAQLAAAGVPVFSRGPAAATAGVRDKKLAGALRRADHLAATAAKSAAAAHAWLASDEAGALEAEPGTLERTWRVGQGELTDLAARGAARKAADLTLPDLAPYSVDYSPSGRFLLLGGKRGHLAMIDAMAERVVTEVFPKDAVRDAAFLHNETFFAAAQGAGVFMYDKRGVELHAAREHAGARRLAFLRQHFLLASIGDGGVLRWQDVTTGEMVASHATRLGDCGVMAVNPHNAVSLCGHANGTVTMWTPNASTPVVRMLTHAGPVRALAVDQSGRHLATAGADGQVKVWDVRTFKPLHAYRSRSPVTAMAISQRALLAVGSPRCVVVWKDGLATKATSPYMRVDLPAGGLRALAFRPFDDVLAVGHAGGVRTALIPGAGEPGLDSFVADPYAAPRARREGEVRALLDKLPANSIVLDPGTIGGVAKPPKEAREAAAAAAAAANAARDAAARLKNEGRARMKGKNKPTRRQRKKQFVIIEEKKATLREKLAAGGGGDGPRAGDEPPPDVPRALARLYKKH
jgi:U3 small nucleolar RNA-associated protein 7